MSNSGEKIRDVEEDDFDKDNQSMSHIQLSQSQADKLKKQVLEVQQLFEKMSQTFSTECADTYYILSKKWLDQWKKYANYDEILAGKPTNKYFGKIHLLPLNHDIIEQQLEACFKYSPLREHPWNVWMKSDLQEGVDYIVVNKEIWNFLSAHHHGTVIPRTVNGEGTEKIVVVNLLRFQALLLYPNIINQISNDMMYKQTFEKEYLQVDRSMKTKEYISLIQKTVPTFRGDYARDNGVRLWKYIPKNNANSNDIQKCLFNDIQKQVQDYDMHDEQSFEFSGELIDPEKYETIEDIGIQSSDLIIVEFKASSKPWCVRNPQVTVEGKCEGCMQIKVLNFPCVCRKVSYCSEDCKKNDERFHSARCEKYGSDDETIKNMTIQPNSAKGVCGLGNLGNTCFMNSGIQCLSNTFPLTDYFLQNKYFEEINEDNPLGTKGKLVRRYGSLLKKVWCGEKSSVTPINFKKAVGQFQPMFKGYHQHDSSELITFLLDGIHEDLNRVKKKPYVESRDSDGRPDFEVAKESWGNHLARNQSVIVDMMYGQYKSKLKCPTCSLVSITFDPFLMVQLGIPSTKKKVIQMKVYTELHTSETVTIPFDKSRALSVGDFKKQLQTDFNIDVVDSLIYIPSPFSSYEPIADTKPLADVRKSAKKGYLCLRKLTPLEQAVPVNERVYLSFQHKGQEGMGYKRTLYMNGIFCFGSNFTLKQVHLLIFRLLIELFKDTLNIENVQDDAVASKLYEEEVFKKYYQLEYKSNSSFWQSCSFCGKKQCQDCIVEFSDETVEEVRNRVLKNDQQCSVELNILWTKSPFKHVKVFDIFDHFQKLKSNVEEEPQQSKINKQNIQRNNSNQMPQQISLQDCLIFSAQPEQLAVDNSWYCRKCQEHVQAFKSMHIYKAPKILIFTLKRFKAQNRIFKQKLETFVDFPVNGLDMTEYVINRNTPNQYEEETQENNGEQRPSKVIYDLFAVSNHFGGLGGGHYTAFAKNHFDRKWYNFDDSHVSQISEDQIITRAAYVLFYQLRTEDQTQIIGNDIEQESNMQVELTTDESKGIEQE